MNKPELKYKLKGNESFDIREGWLNKGITAIQCEPSIFSSENAMDKLGIGSKMVRSLKFWLLATGLAKEKKSKNSKNILQLTKNLGEIINEYDKYFEDIFTLWILHYHIVSNIEMCTIWNLFFNKFSVTDFSKTNMINRLTDEFNKIYNRDNSIYNSVTDDCSSILKMYSITSENDLSDPEDNLSSPFSELGLIKKSDKERGNYSKIRPIYDKLDRLAVLYIIVTHLEKTNSVDIDTLTIHENNIGKVLNLDRTMINEYLDQLKQEGFITLNRTAGLDKVYLKKEITPKEILIQYYTQSEREF